MFFQVPLWEILEQCLLDLYIKIWIRESDLHFFFHLKKSCTLFQTLFVFCYTMTYFVSVGVIKDRTTKIYPKYFNGKLWPYHLPCFMNSFLYDLACKTWCFEKVVFELEASYSFKINCILVRQILSLKKIGVAISKNCCFVSWSPICTPLILVSALMKMASTSTTVIYNSMKVKTPGKLVT